MFTPTSLGLPFEPDVEVHDEDLTLRGDGCRRADGGHVGAGAVVGGRHAGATEQAATEYLWTLLLGNILTGWRRNGEASINWNIRPYFSFSLIFVYFLGNLAICRLADGGVGRACGFYWGWDDVKFYTSENIKELITTEQGENLLTLIMQ